MSSGAIEGICTALFVIGAVFGFLYAEHKAKKTPERVVIRADDPDFLALVDKFREAFDSLDEDLPPIPRSRKNAQVTDITDRLAQRRFHDQGVEDDLW